MRYKERQRADSRWPAGISWGLALCALLSPGLAGETPGSAEPSPLEQALACVQDSMTRSPAPWPDTWQREYVDAIRQAIAPHPDTAQYAMRLEILSRGFQPYWEGLKKGQDRSLFEVHCAEIRWYVESLMNANLPGDEEMQALRRQYEDLFHYAASSLLTQFAFLDPNAVHRGETDHLAQCYQRIEAPLLPICLHVFSQAQLERIKGRWHDLRYARVDLWRQLRGDDTPRARDVVSSPEQAKPLQEHPDYLLTLRSLAQLQAQLWAMVGPAPDYYRATVLNHINVQKRHVQSRIEARNQERRLPRAVLQAEQISFLLAALLETAREIEQPPVDSAGAGGPAVAPGRPGKDR